MKQSNKQTAFVTVTVLSILFGFTFPQEVKSVEPYNQSISGQLENGISGHAKSLPILDDRAKLDDYLAYAALNNAKLEAAFNRWKAALQRVPQAKSLPDPRFTYGYFIREVETRVGPQRQRFGLSQMLPWFGKLRLRGEIAFQEAYEAYEAYEAEKLTLFYHVKDAYYEYHYLWHAIDITEDSIQLLQRLEGVAQAKYRAGAPLSGVIKIQIELGKLEDQRRQLLDLLGPIETRLNAALNRRPDVPISRPAEFATSTVVFEDAQLLEWLEHRNPQLKQLDTLVTKHEKMVSLAKKDRLPDVTLGIDYIGTSKSITPVAIDSGKDPILATISFNLPIWIPKNRAAIREANAHRDEAVNTRASKQNLLAADLKLAAYNLRDAARKIQLYGKSLILQAKESLSVTEQAYETGKADYLELIDAQQLLLEFQLQYQRALTNHEQRLAEIEMLIARRLPQISTGSSMDSDVNTLKEEAK